MLAAAAAATDVDYVKTVAEVTSVHAVTSSKFNELMLRVRMLRSTLTQYRRMSSAMNSLSRVSYVEMH